MSAYWSNAYIMPCKGWPYFVEDFLQSTLPVIEKDHTEVEISTHCSEEPDPLSYLYVPF